MTGDDKTGQRRVEVPDSDMSRLLFQKREEALRGTPRDGPTSSTCQGLQLGGANRSTAGASEIRRSGVVLSSIPEPGAASRKRPTRALKCTIPFLLCIFFVKDKAHNKIRALSQTGRRYGPQPGRGPHSGLSQEAGAQEQTGAPITCLAFGVMA